MKRKAVFAAMLIICFLVARSAFAPPFTTITICVPEGHWDLNESTDLIHWFWIQPKPCTPDRCFHTGPTNIVIQIEPFTPYKFFRLTRASPF